MLTRADHVTIAVTDLPAARGFFELLGFRTTITAVVSAGHRWRPTWGCPGSRPTMWTMVLEGAASHFEIQLLHFRHPVLQPDPTIANLARPGLNHLCFATDDIEGDIARFTAAGGPPAQYDDVASTTASSCSSKAPKA